MDELERRARVRKDRLEERHVVQEGGDLRQAATQLQLLHHRAGQRILVEDVALPVFGLLEPEVARIEWPPSHTDDPVDLRCLVELPQQRAADVSGRPGDGDCEAHYGSRSSAMSSGAIIRTWRR